MSVISVPGLIRGGQAEKYGEGDKITCTVKSGQSATGGLGLDFQAGDRLVQTSGAGSVIFAGLALYDAAALAKVVCVMEGVWFVTATGAIVSGNPLIAAASGQFSAAGATPDARTLVGKAIADIAGAASGPAKFR